LRVIRLTLGLARHWLTIFIVAFGILNILPIVAPVTMRLGWMPIGDAIYTFYSPLCHQMAQRSFFLFGPQVMNDLNALPLNFTGNKVADMLLLREFQGNQELGWKVAWSDRMVAMYGGFWLAGVIYSLLRRNRRLKPISIWILLLLPAIAERILHLMSDLVGLTTVRYNSGCHLTAHSHQTSFIKGIPSGFQLVGVASGVIRRRYCSVWLPFVDQESRFIATLSEVVSIMTDSASPE
jgi:uncharacterized membrane protein